MKKLITSFLAFLFALIAIAQTDSVDYYLPSKPVLSAKDSVSVSVSMGAGLGFFNQTKNTAYTTFIAPKIGYQFTPKFNLNVGLMHYTVTGNTFMALNQHEALLNTSKRTASGNLLFVEGEYLLNKRLIMSGAVMLDANELNVNKRNNFKAGSLALEYKITEHSSIKFETIISKGQGNYYNNPNPFSSSKFNSFESGFYNRNSMFR